MKRTAFIIALALILLVSCIQAFGAQQDKPVLKAKEDASIKVPAADAVFKDISGHWAEDVIDRMTSKGIISGVGDNLFQPDRNMKRCEFAGLIHRALGIRIMYFAAPDITDTYKDVKNEDWYASALCDLVTAGIADDKAYFRPDAPITREEMVHYVINGYKYKLKTELDTGSETANSFSDANEISKAYLNDVNNAVKLGFILGKGGNLFKPKGYSTRAEALTVVERVLNAVDTEDANVKIEPGFEENSGIFKMKLDIANNSTSDIKINHNSSQKYDFVLLDKNRKELYRWSSERMFAQVLTYTLIPAGEKVEFTEELDLKTYGDIINKAVYMKIYITGRSEGFKISPDGYEAVLKPS